MMLRGMPTLVCDSDEVRQPMPWLDDTPNQEMLDLQRTLRASIRLHHFLVFSAILLVAQLARHDQLYHPIPPSIHQSVIHQQHTIFVVFRHSFGEVQPSAGLAPLEAVLSLLFEAGAR